MAAPLRLHSRRRISGHQPRAVRIAATFNRSAPELVRRGRRGSIHLPLARRGRLHFAELVRDFPNACVVKPRTQSTAPRRTFSMPPARWSPIIPSASAKSSARKMARAATYDTLKLRDAQFMPSLSPVSWKNSRTIILTRPASSPSTAPTFNRAPLKKSSPPRAALQTGWRISAFTSAWK